jgi:hypothetical protein
MTDPDLSHKKELADVASALANDKAFTGAVLSLRKRWFDELIASDSTDKVLELKARIKALEAIPTELNVLMNDYKMAKR